MGSSRSLRRLCNRLIYARPLGQWIFGHAAVGALTDG
jgi:hypothetical protein